MPYTIVLYFNQQTEALIRSYWERLANENISTELPDSGIRPHITLAIYEELNCQSCESELANFAREASHLTIPITHLGIFNNPDSVLFLAPTATKELLDFHARIHTCLLSKAQKSWEIYQPGAWVPHCTLAMNLNAQQLSRAVSICSDIHLPIELRATQIGAVEFVSAEELFNFNLKNP
jgi:2'-5' RNA ligase